MPIIIAMLICLCQTYETFAQTRRALVIGLGEQEDTSWGKINGDKDVPYVCKILRSAGFKDVKTLVNRQATKTKIVHAFKSMNGRCKAGDIVYIHFSGHGQQMTDIDGDEKDNLDEAWIPYDAYRKYGDRDNGEKHLSDDEIYVLLSSIKKKIGDRGKLLVVVDACHSGDSSRGEEGEDVVRGVHDTFTIPKLKDAVAKSTYKDEPWLLLSACKSYQINMEMKNPAVGKLTYGIIQVIRDNSVKNNEQFLKALELFFVHHRGRLPQNPVLSGSMKVKYNITDILR